MARTKISFGHKQLTSGVVRDRKCEAGGQGFDSALFGFPVGPLPVLKKFPIFSVYFFAFHITAGFTPVSVYKNWQ